jgi:hypothetical protein
MAREKLNSKVVFGQKIHASLTNGCTCLHIISWDAFSESPSMMDCPERHNNLSAIIRKRFSLTGLTVPGKTGRN